MSFRKLQEELNGQTPKKPTTYKDIQNYIEEKVGGAFEKKADIDLKGLRRINRKMSAWNI